jgi:phosphoserine phosphatase RsbU/P
MSDFLDSFRLRNKEQINIDKMDERFIELSSLLEFSQTLNSSLKLKSILDNLLFVPMGRMMIGKGMVLLYRSKKECKIATVKGMDETLVNNTFTFPEKPQEIIIITSEQQYKDLPEIFSRYNLKLIIPIKSKNEVKGILTLGGKMIPGDFSQDEIHFLSSIGNIAAPAIENAQMFEQLNSLNNRLDQKVQELNTLFEIGNELNRFFDRDEILKRLSFSLMGQMLINQFFVAIKENDHLKLVYKKGAIFKDENIEKCLNSELPLLHKPLVIKSEENSKFSSICKYGVKIIVPMMSQDKVSGYIFLGDKLNKSELTESDIEFLSTLANIATISLENARLFQETLEKKRLEEELNMAKSIQSRLLPSAMPDLKRFDVHGYNIPSKSVGGDYFDIIKINENEFIFTIADVSGKGMPASLLMSNLQAGLHTLYSENYTLSEITFRLNNLIYRNTNIEKYITFFISKLNISENKIEFVNAGHNPPYLFYPDGHYEELTTGGIILGMMENMPFETGSLEIKPGCWLTMFTDGVTEAMSPEEIPFDEFRVIEFFKKEILASNSEQMNLKLINVLYDFAGDPTKDDDITILTLHRCE